MGKNIFHTGSSANFNSILDNGLWAGGCSLRSTRQVCFFSRLNPQDSSSRQRTIEWTGPDQEPRVVRCKQSNRPDHDCIYSFILRGAQDANFVLHQSCSDALILYDNIWVSALDKVVTVAGEVFNQAGGDSWRQT